jgi:hypothetical protein
MKINVYTKNNGVGLQADAELLRSILTEHDVVIIDWERPLIRLADVGIHLEHIRIELRKLAPYNISIPNPEWFEPNWMNRLSKVDAIYCKTHFTFDIFSKMHKNCVYCGWTSIDKYVESIEKKFMFLHLAGKSKHKGSEVVLHTWRYDSELPLLYLQKIENIKGFYVELPNVVTQFKRVSDIRTIMNQSLFHLCPSKAEGFGHYINEALSTGAVVITTDAPPMNELVTPDCGFIVKANICGKHHLSNEYCVDKNVFKSVVRQAINTPIDTLLDMSIKARQLFLQRDKEFKVTINGLINHIPRQQ